MTKPQPKARELHDVARKALDDLRRELRDVLAAQDLAPFLALAQQAEDAIDDADAWLLRAVADIEDAAGKVM